MHKNYIPRTDADRKAILRVLSWDRRYQTPDQVLNKLNSHGHRIAGKNPVKTVQARLGEHVDEGRAEKRRIGGRCKYRFYFPGAGAGTAYLNNDAIDSRPAKPKPKAVKAVNAVNIADLPTEDLEAELQRRLNAAEIKKHNDWMFKNCHAKSKIVKLMDEWNGHIDALDKLDPGHGWERTGFMK